MYTPAHKHTHTLLVTGVNFESICYQTCSIITVNSKGQCSFVCVCVCLLARMPM